MTKALYRSYHSNSQYNLSDQKKVSRRRMDVFIVTCICCQLGYEYSLFSLSRKRTGQQPLPLNFSFTPKHSITVGEVIPNSIENSSRSCLSSSTRRRRQHFRGKKVINLAFLCPVYLRKEMRVPQSR